MQRTAGDQRHDEKRQPESLADFVDWDHVFVGYGCCRPRLAFETSPSRGAVGQPRREHFHGHRSLECRVETLEHHAHPTATDQIANFVASQFAELAFGRRLQKGERRL